MLQLAQARYGERAVQVVVAWQEMMLSAQSLSEADKVRRVNEFFNRRIQFGEDQAIWGVNDYWATPLEFMGRGIGDCEDFSIAKYFSLRSLGVPLESLRITYVRARIGGPRSEITQAHMVLAYYEEPTGEPLILDNLITEVRPASRRGDLMPIFSFNSEGLWTGAGAAERKDAGSSTARLSRWRDLIARMRAEGYE
ncbi:MAG: transglutaminase-like cysteine peptidase [Sulfuritalea sp.]|nr:transglutaminase-like cysteine peptidase [Sulfuritalea sp.]